jgi:predicted small metal-binding protein
MARLLKCEDIGIECDYICADSEENLFNRAAQYAKMDERSIEMPSEFRDRVISLSRPVEHC